MAINSEITDEQIQEFLNSPENKELFDKIFEEKSKFDEVQYTDKKPLTTK